MSEDIEQPFLDKPDRDDQGPIITTLDDLLTRVDGEGKYQKISFVIFNLQWFFFAWMLLGGSFFFQTTDFVCGGLSKEQCQKYVCGLDSKEWRRFLPENHPKSIPYQFEPIFMCNYSYIVTVLKSLVYIGSLIGFFVIPYIADNWGRKRGMLISWGTCSLGIVLLAFAQEVTMVAFGYFMAGFGGNPAITLDYSFINQQSLGKARQYFSVGIQISLAIGQALLGVLFLGIPNWRTVSYILLGPVLLINVLNFYLIESPKFMISKDSDMTLKIFNKIAKINKRPKLKLIDILEVQQNSEEAEQSGSSLVDLFRYKSLRWKALGSGIVFLGIQVVYYSTSLNLDSVGLNLYLNQAVVGVSQGLGYVAAQFAIPKVRRKRTSYFGMGISSILCLLLAFIPTHGAGQYISLALLIVMRFTLSMFWAIFFVFLAEMFPTRVRSLAFGWASAMGTIGSAASPYIIAISDSVNLSSWLFPGIVGLLSTACIYPLDQTLGLELQEQIQELRLKQDQLKYDVYEVNEGQTAGVNNTQNQVQQGQEEEEEER